MHGYDRRRVEELADESMARREFQDRYSSEFMTALKAIATPRRQTNLLQHMLGYFEQALDRESRAELLALIQDYGGGRVSLVVALTFASGAAGCRIWPTTSICGRIRSS